MYVLIIMTWMGGYVSGAVVTTVDFPNENRCNAAKEQVLTEARRWDVGDSKFRAFCVNRSAS